MGTRNYCLPFLGFLSIDLVFAHTVCLVLPVYARMMTATNAGPVPPLPVRRLFAHSARMNGIFAGYFNGKYKKRPTETSISDMVLPLSDPPRLLSPQR